MPNCEAVDLPDFRTPPIIEVVCGVRFVPLQDWVIPHVGAYWHRVRDRFPRVEHAQPLPGGIEIFDSTTNIPLPRIWLINETDDRLVQLQSGRFFFNWRHRGNDYPRFRNLYVEFCEMFNGFVEFVNENDLGDVSVEAFELTYINHVFEGDGWGLPEMIGKVVPHMGLSIGSCPFPFYELLAEVADELVRPVDSGREPRGVATRVVCRPALAGDVRLSL